MVPLEVANLIIEGVDASIAIEAIEVIHHIELNELWEVKAALAIIERIESCFLPTETLLSPRESFSRDESQSSFSTVSFESYMGLGWMHRPCFPLPVGA